MVKKEEIGADGVKFNVMSIHRTLKGAVSMHEAMGYRVLHTCKTYAYMAIGSGDNMRFVWIDRHFVMS